MKKLKSIISVLLAVVLVASVFAACKNKKNDDKNNKSATVTVAVTDENGQTVTDKNGEIVTEVITGDNSSEGGVVSANGASGSDSSASASASGSAASGGAASNSGAKNSNGKSNSASASNGKNKNIIKKPAAPSTPKLSVSGISKDSLTLSWNDVKCTAYQVRYRIAGAENWTWATKKTTAKKINFKNSLEPYTDYEFQLRAYNQNNGGTSTSKWTSAKAKTKEDKKYSRNLKVNVKLPFDSNVKDKLRIYVKESSDKKEKLVNEADVRCDGSTYSFTTKDKVKGVVNVRVELVNHKASAQTKTNGNSCSFEITVGIDSEFDEV